MINFKVKVHTKAMKVVKKSSLCLLVISIIAYFILAIQFIIS
jgi:hypothetical protein